MQDKHLLFPLIILCGVTGGLMLIGSTFITLNPVILPAPYLFVLTSVFLYMRHKKNLVGGTTHVCLTLFSVFLLMTLIMYSYTTVMGLGMFLPIAFASSSVMLFLFAGCRIVFFVQEKKKRSNYVVEEKQTTTSLL